MIGLENLVIYWLGRPNLGTGQTISANLLTRKLPERISPGHLERVFREMKS